MFRKLTPEHRLVLYGAFLVPFIIYHCLKDKPYQVKKLCILYYCLGAMWTFLFRQDLTDYLHPATWPLHLCNTAVFVLPFCLIFNAKKLFNFTVFINVFGALIAMLMPNTGEGLHVLSWDVIIFFNTHFVAFFMPVLILSLDLFERPKLKQWIYSMIWFAVYFVAMLFTNALLSNIDPDVDFFFLNQDYIVSKLGDWAVKTRDLKFSFNIGEWSLTFYPVYQTLYFIAYTALSVAMWFLYSLLFRIWDSNRDLRAKRRDYKKLQKELSFLLEKKKENSEMAKDSKPVLELKHFYKKYGTNNYYSVEDASLKIEGGEIFGFLGPNGAGKSTTIKSIVGIQTISKGNIEVCGYDVTAQPVEAKKEIGFVPDHYALYENLTGREYINYIADLYGVSKEDRDERITKYVHDFQLENAFDNQMKTYSHGMKQKMTIMAALVHDPKVWILDEPLTGLDPQSIYQVKLCMINHAKEGNIVFFSSHIIDVVEKLCTRIAIIKKGHIVYENSMEGVLKEPPEGLEQFYMETIRDNGDND